MRLYAIVCCSYLPPHSHARREYKVNLKRHRTMGLLPRLRLRSRGRNGQQGSVSVSQSTAANGGNSVDLIQSSVNVQGPYSGSTANGVNTGGVIVLTLQKALDAGLRNNLGAINQSQSVVQAEGQRQVARSTLLPNVNSVVTETVEQLNLRTSGVLESSFPLAVGPFNFFDARAAQVSQSVFDLVRLHNFRSAGENAKAAVQSARDSRDLITLAVGDLICKSSQRRLESPPRMLKLEFPGDFSASFRSLGCRFEYAHRRDTRGSST